MISQPKISYLNNTKIKKLSKLTSCKQIFAFQPLERSFLFLFHSIAVSKRKRNEPKRKKKPAAPSQFASQRDIFNYIVITYLSY